MLIPLHRFAVAAMLLIGNNIAAQEVIFSETQPEGLIYCIAFKTNYLKAFHTLRTATNPISVTNVYEITGEIAVCYSNRISGTNLTLWRHRTRTMLKFVDGREVAHPKLVEETPTIYGVLYDQPNRVFAIHLRYGPNKRGVVIRDIGFPREMPASIYYGLWGILEDNRVPTKCEFTYTPAAKGRRTTLKLEYAAGETETYALGGPPENFFLLLPKPGDNPVK